MIMWEYMICPTCATFPSSKSPTPKNDRTKSVLRSYYLSGKVYGQVVVVVVVVFVLVITVVAVNAMVLSWSLSFSRYFPPEGIFCYKRSTRCGLVPTRIRPSTAQAHVYELVLVAVAADTVVRLHVAGPVFEILAIECL